MRKIFSSATLMSWTSFLTKAAGVIVILPLMVTRFSTADVALWYIFVTAINFQILADLGVSSTLVRMFSYARSGLATSELKNLQRQYTQETGRDYNWDTIKTIWQVMNFIYVRIGLSLLVFISLTSYFLYHPILKSSDPARSAIAWVVIVVTSFIQLRYSTFSNYLQGMNQIALVKKWETFLNSFSIITNCLILYFGGDILILVISNQFWAIVTIIRDLSLSRSISAGRYKTLDTRSGKNAIVFDAIWPSVWRSGIGVLMSFGVLQIINMVMASDGKSKVIASYLLGYNLMRQISVFSQVPFYSRIPLLAQLRAQGDITSFTKVISRGMNLSYWSFILPVIAVGAIGTFGLKYIHSHVNFPTLLLWGSLSLGILLERAGAMHIQIYSTSNKIIWHIANGVTGTLVILVCIALKPYIGIYSVTVAIIAGNLLFYTWYCMYHSYKEFKFNFFRLEGRGLLPCLFITLAYLFFAWLVR
jgi:hypothetical protein